MRLQGTRFGAIEFDAGDLLTLHEGLIGFPALRHFVLICPNPESPFRWLQSVEEPATAFLLVDPLHYFADYAPTLPASVEVRLGIAPGSPRCVLATASIPPGKPAEMTVNLLAPVVVNPESRTGMQVILDDEAYTTRHRVLQAARKESETVAA